MFCHLSILSLSLTPDVSNFTCDISRFLRIRTILIKKIISTMAVDMSSPKAMQVKELISSDKIVIFSKSYCPYCKLAKEVFDKLKEAYTVIELDDRSDGEEIQAILGKITGARTVPRVFVKETCLGGGSDVKALFEKGELQKLVA